MDEDKITKEEFGELVNTAEDEKRPIFLIFQDTDGNWRGGTEKFGEFVNVRDIGPETVLQRLLTHDGTK